MKKIFSWITESNRLKHLMAGVAIMALMMAVALFANDIFEYKFNVFVILAFFGVFFSMLAVEFTQHFLCKVGKFDWLDILAGCLIPLLFTLLIILV